jgi:hypothetical protein
VAEKTTKRFPMRSLLIGIASIAFWYVFFVNQGNSLKLVSFSAAIAVLFLFLILVLLWRRAAKSKEEQ